ncbi:hypothetical protein C7M46_00012 [Pediococcus pentosaceus]|uniref:capsid assembly scaffolding protein Gp46 family protein n=1 Tax=Pediococcus pentosaceus TaxID=1255 RepID=UPI001362A9E5|nr:DUF4355 domain-containing protein [Pediococcus pentosaceus]QHM59369.1 hypothetical protein C7M46_00012 [Pediococcus pentosaceus]
MELKNVLPMNLQFFAEEPDNPDSEPTDPIDTPAGGDGEEGKDGDGTNEKNNIDSDKTVEKLKSRLDSKTAENHDLKQKYEEQSQLLDDLKSGRKSIKELASEDKKSEEETKKDEEIANLKAEIARTKAINDTNAVFKEQGLVVSDEVLNMVVGNGTDNDAIYENVKALTDLINSTKDDVRKEFMAGKTPKINTHSDMSAGVKIAQERNQMKATINNPWTK